jgi:23S rRNA (adenine2030-N6)-methyltransferase
MNYQHAFHAGNFADVHKHAVLARILVHLRYKSAAFRIIDTHAGAGCYDLLDDAATRGGEWHNGIERLWRLATGADSEAAAFGGVGDLLAPYLDIVRATNPGGALRTYPGSPLIVLGLLRPQDRLIACELEPRAAALLAAALRSKRQAKAVAIDGWTALGAYVPPKERRGLVLVDPPFEEGNDFARLSAALAEAHRKWPTGIYLLWYPIKDRGGPDALARRLKKLAIPKIVRCEITLGPSRADAGLLGSGLIVVNPPYGLVDELRRLLPGLCRMLSAKPRSEPASTAPSEPVHRLDWLAAEA